MSDDQNPTLGPGSPGTEDFWTNMDRKSDSEYLHNKRMSRLHQRNVSFAAQQFQSQMLGLMLIGEASMPLSPVIDIPPVVPDAAPQLDPTSPA